MKGFVRFAQGLLAAIFLMSGLMKVFESSEEIQTLYTDVLGYSVGFMRIVGVVESLAAIGLIAGYRRPRFTLVSTGILAIIMAGATISTSVSKQAATTAVVPFVLLALAVVITIQKPPCRSLQPIMSATIDTAGFPAVFLFFCPNLRHTSAGFWATVI